MKPALPYGIQLNRISASSSANMDMEELSSGRASARSCFACSSPFSHSSTRLAPFLKFSHDTTIRGTEQEPFFRVPTRAGAVRRH